MGWDNDEINLLDDYLLGYTSFKNQEEVAQFLGKTLNAFKIRCSRRRNEKEFLMKEKKTLSIEEYKFFLSNRFTKTSNEIADILGISVNFLLHELDELDSLETLENLEDGFQRRTITQDEFFIFQKLYKKGKNKFQLSHILNRPISIIEGMIATYEAV